MRHLTLLGAVLVAAACSSLPDEAMTGEEALARSDYEAITSLAGAAEGTRTGAGLQAAGSAYQLGLQWPVAHALSTIYAGALGVTGDALVVGAAPLMGSRIQDWVEDASHAAYRQGVEFDRVWKAIPPVSPPGNDLYLRDRQEGPREPLRLSPSDPDRE